MAQQEVFFPIQLTRSEILTLIAACDDRDGKLFNEIERLQKTTGTNRDKIDLLASYRFRNKRVRARLVAAQAATTIKLNKTTP